MPSILDKAFKGELRLLCRCEERFLRRSNPLVDREIASFQDASQSQSALATTHRRRSRRYGTYVPQVCSGVIRRGEGSTCRADMCPRRAQVALPSKQDAEHP